jgi:hypothetical protein
MKKCFFLLVLLMIAGQTPAQYNQAVKNKIIDLNAVVNANTLTYYGLGFVIHPVEFNHIDEIAKCYFTFFDIAAKNIVWICETTGRINGNGTTQWYGFAMVECTRNYIDQVYKRNIKK